MGNVLLRLKRRHTTSIATQTEAYIPTKDDLKQVNCLEVYDANIDYVGMKGYARVDSIYDGDTATFVFWHDALARYIRVRVRMAHYDSPEIKGATTIEQELAVKAKEEFETLVRFKDGSGRRVKKESRYDSTSDIVWFEVTGMDTKWNRPVVMAWNTEYPHRSINAIIHEKWSVDYEGKTKEHVWGENRTVNTSYDKPLSIPL